MPEVNKCVHASARENDTRKNKLINFNIVGDIPLAYRAHEAEVKHS